MIGAYYEETYLLAFITVGISALACSAAIIGIASSIVNVSMSKQEVKKFKPVLMLLPFAFTVGSLILNVIPLVFYANM
jgi:F0F1-type ATP synthase membrane subunit c/vacuolar-type H+-ATPase subunit K